MVKKWYEKPYSNTKKSVQESLADIKSLLAKYGVIGFQETSIGNFIQLRFIIEENELKSLARDMGSAIAFHNIENTKEIEKIESILKENLRLDSEVWDTDIRIRKAELLKKLSGEKTDRVVGDRGERNKGNIKTLDVSKTKDDEQDPIEYMEIDGKCIYNKKECEKLGWILTKKDSKSKVDLGLSDFPTPEYMSLEEHSQEIKKLFTKFLNSMDYIMEKIEFHTENHDSELMDDVSNIYEKYKEQLDEMK